VARGMAQREKICSISHTRRSKARAQKKGDWRDVFPFITENKGLNRRNVCHKEERNLWRCPASAEITKNAIATDYTLHWMSLHRQAGGAVFLHRGDLVRGWKEMGLAGPRGRFSGGQGEAKEMV